MKRVIIMAVIILCVTVWVDGSAIAARVSQTSANNQSVLGSIYGAEADIPDYPRPTTSPAGDTTILKSGGTITIGPVPHNGMREIPWTDIESPGTGSNGVENITNSANPTCFAVNAYFWLISALW
ncbi:MAG: hypothetical protein NT002_10245 [candidate division Zixibacteria bacterium]|nr:hypothetical protein [candidate division Zixibacteria bacterium]